MSVAGIASFLFSKYDTFHMIILCVIIVFAYTLYFVFNERRSSFHGNNAFACFCMYVNFLTEKSNKQVLKYDFSKEFFFNF